MTTMTLIPTVCDEEDALFDTDDDERCQYCGYVECQCYTDTYVNGADDYEDDDEDEDEDDDEDDDYDDEDDAWCVDCCGRHCACGYCCPLEQEADTYAY